jgi:CcmD family protein
LECGPAEKDELTIDDFRFTIGRPQWLVSSLPIVSRQSAIGHSSRLSGSGLPKRETDVPDNLGYLMAAYSLMWVIFLLYAWSIASRQGQLKKDLEDLKSRLGRKSGAE